ncbi:hypothetical protein PY257_08630 [Ramlibacter sp. H39-3-26]|uniref:hypothetical protein n=1 Tax=Curvibacter soli TaxID=3031331 RepID=UPI0023DCB73E|nr:hypothetical protein [Ramlibacter sp. H39-3-26]MDF1485245.1 hypothetical protein [Ramlibacter sp. H39-3-26]
MTDEAALPFLAAELPAPSPAQQEVLARIARQRGRLRQERLAREEEALLEAQAQSLPPEPGAPFAARLAYFARQHPVAVSALAGGLLAALGPARMLRWAGWLLPIALRRLGR